MDLSVHSGDQFLIVDAIQPMVDATILKRKILQYVKERDFYNDPWVQGFGIVVKDEMAQLDGQYFYYVFYKLGINYFVEKKHIFRTSTARP
jgi:hypothetical protein